MHSVNSRFSDTHSPPPTLPRSNFLAGRSVQRGSGCRAAVWDVACKVGRFFLRIVSLLKECASWLCRRERPSPETPHGAATTFVKESPSHDSDDPPILIETDWRWVWVYTIRDWFFGKCL